MHLLLSDILFFAATDNSDRPSATTTGYPTKLLNARCTLTVRSKKQEMGLITSSYGDGESPGETLAASERHPCLVRHTLAQAFYAEIPVPRQNLFLFESQGGASGT